MSEAKKAKIAAQTSADILINDQPSCSTQIDNNTTSKPENITTKNPSDEMKDALTCSVCYDVFLDCFSLQSCQHCFCAACASDWLTKNDTCPECRSHVKKVARNHRMNNLVEAFLASNKNVQKRSPAEIDLMKAKNVFSKDMMSIKEINKNSTRNDGNLSSSCDESEDFYSGDDLTDSDDFSNTNFVLSALAHHNVLQQQFVDKKKKDVHGKHLAYSPMQVPLCVQCRTYGQAPYNTMTNFINQPTKKLPNFVCKPNQRHIACECCKVMMPDRRTDPTFTKTTPLECTLCHRVFCHQYFGCSKYGCKGCLNRFKDFDFDPTIFTTVVNENSFETEILRKFYLEPRKIDWHTFFNECSTKMDCKELECRAMKQYPEFSSSTAVCLECAIMNFRDLAYNVRKTINQPNQKSDCWYGRNCRTQKNNRTHAEKLNHICEQTRFK